MALSFPAASHVGTSNTARGYLRYIKLDYAALGVRIQEPVDVSLILSVRGTIEEQ